MVVANRKRPGWVMEHMEHRATEETVRFLSGLDPEISARMDEVLERRTRFLTVVAEDLYQPHNGAAVIRACECFGVQDLYAMPRTNHFQVSEEVVSGASQWVDVHGVTEPDPANTQKTISALKEKGYRIGATTLREGCIPISEVPTHEKLALCFGAEERGLSEEAHDLADFYVRIPMYGFTQSFNISVSVAICLFDWTVRLRSSQAPWQLSAEEKLKLKAQWLLKYLPEGPSQLEAFLAGKGP